MSEEQDIQWAEFEKIGEEQVRKNLGMKVYSEIKTGMASEWLAHRKALQESEDRRKTLGVADDANRLAREANDLARRANSTAIDASNSAKRSADAAQKNNGIALLALAIAVLAVIAAAIPII